MQVYTHYLEVINMNDVTDTGNRPLFISKLESEYVHEECGKSYSDCLAIPRDFDNHPPYFDVETAVIQDVYCGTFSEPARRLSNNGIFVEIKYDRPVVSSSIPVAFFNGYEGFQLLVECFQVRRMEELVGKRTTAYLRNEKLAGLAALL
jgi:hypothetical protein